MSTYFALTIGPIYKTMAMANKLTRELWAASYLFSYLMESIVNSKELKGELVLPAKSEVKDTVAGLYPDRLILKLPEEGFSYDDARNIVDNIWWEIIKNLPVNDDNGRLKIFFETYFQIYSLEISVSEKEDPIKVIIPLLDSLEQKVSYVPEFDTNFLEKFLQNVSHWGKFEKIFGKNHRFPSVLEIAVQGLKDVKNQNTPELIKNYQPGNDIFSNIFDYCLENEGKTKIIDGKKVKINDNTTINLLKEVFNPKETSKKEEEIFRFYHRYMATVQADGDNLSQALHALYTLGGIPAIKEFSVFLMDFGNEATKLIKEYGGTPIYMGGDDLLFFAPVKSKEKKTVFHLVWEIDDLFKKKIQEPKEKYILKLLNEWNSSATAENRRKKIELSVSYGISICYHKFPLKESLETARKLLFEEAKLVIGKDSVSFRLLKHSGQFFGTNWKKGTKENWTSSFIYFLEMLDEFEIDINFLTSLQHKLNPLRPILYRILTNRVIDPSKMKFQENIIKYLPNELGREMFLKRLNNNFFNEIDHKKYHKFLEYSFVYLLHVYRELEDTSGNCTQTAQKAVDTLYASLRFIQFINQPDHNLNEEEN